MSDRRIHGFFREGLVPFLVEVVAGTTVVVAGLLVVQTVFWGLIVLACAGLAMLFLLYMRNIAIRSAVVTILSDVSASRCHDRFIRFLAQAMRSSRTVRSHESEIQLILNWRKHPNVGTVAPIRFMLDSAEGSPETRHRVLKYLDSVRLAKDGARARVCRNVNAYLRSHDDRPTYIVLYGYSRTVCQSLCDEQGLRATIIIIQDYQYGDHSHAEHELARTHLERAGLRPHVIAFEKLQELWIEQNFVANDKQGHVTLSDRRRVIVLIGCEACSIIGDVLIPSHPGAEFAETAKFVEVLRRAIDDSTAKISTSIVVVTEAYKIYPALSDDLSEVGAPLEVWRGAAAYRLGFRAEPPRFTVRLVRLTAVDYTAVIDDAGVHEVHDLSIDLSDAAAMWTADTIDTVSMRAADGDVLRGCDAFVLDMNGVLVNDEVMHFRAFEELVHEGRDTLTFQEYLDCCFGRTDTEGLSRLVAAGKLKGALPILVAKKHAKYEEFSSGGIRVFPGALDLVRKLIAARKRVFLVTASSRTEAMRFAEAAGIGELVADDHIYAEVQAAGRRDIYSAIVARVSAAPERVLVVDDSPSNIRVARSLGMKTVAITTSHAAQDFAADRVASDAQVLAKML